MKIDNIRDLLVILKKNNGINLLSNYKSVIIYIMIKNLNDKDICIKTLDYNFKFK